MRWKSTVVTLLSCCFGNKPLVVCVDCHWETIASLCIEQCCQMILLHTQSCYTCSCVLSNPFGLIVFRNGTNFPPWLCGRW
jgi:hypothetical protein